MRALRLHTKDTGELFLVSPLHLVEAHPGSCGGSEITTSPDPDCLTRVREELDQVEGEWNDALRGIPSGASRPC
jgi:hypothetical protein